MRSSVVVLLLLAACPGARAQPQQPGPAGNVQARGSLANARIRFEKEKVGHVAFLGGSITEMNGYRPLVCGWLARRFPETRFTFTDAGVSSTCSTTAAFRLASDVLAKGPGDLLFVEFAVNDDQDAGHGRRACIRGMEGIVRQLRAHNPAADVVITYFVNPAMLETLQAGKVPLTIASHEEVARHYAVASVNLAREVAQRIGAGTLTWASYGGVHPAPAGNELCASMIGEMLDTAWKKPLGADAARAPYPLPGPLDPGHYGQGQLLDPARAVLAGGWRLETPDWKSLAGSCRERFRKAVLLCAEKPGAELTVDFEGKTVGAYVLAGPDAGTVEAVVDGGPPVAVDLYHPFSRGLHYPRTVIFATDLKPGRHTLKLRTTSRKNQASQGTAARVLHLVAG